MVHAAAAPCSGNRCLLSVPASVLRLLHLTVSPGTEEIKVLQLISQAYHPVVGACFIDLYTRHREVQHTCATELHLGRQVVVERGIHAD